MKKNAMRIFAALLLMVLLPVMALAAGFAVVKGGKLNLREYASASSRSLGKYDTGSWVQVLSRTDGFAQVRTMDGKSGYMSEGYLNFGSDASMATVKYANGGYVNLRMGPSLETSVLMRVTSGTSISIINDSSEWNYVCVNVGGNSVFGYMHDSLINRTVTTATVTTRNGGKVNVRSGPSGSYSSVGTLRSGTKVNVLLKGSGWYQIYAEGLTGFMSTQYLSGTGSTVGSNTGSGTTSTQIAYVNNPRSTQVLNLRETPSQTARSIGQYRNGTQVKVVSRGSTWSEVYVGTRHGYMMTRYLSFNGVYVTPAPATTPVYVYVTPTPTPLVQWITPVPTATPPVQLITPKPNGEGPAAPAVGTSVTLAIAAGSGSNMINVYNDRALTSLSASYAPGTKVTMLQYDENICMVLINSSVCFVPTGNVNY